jgi:hypothetical protein
MHPIPRDNIRTRTQTQSGWPYQFTFHFPSSIHFYYFSPGLDWTILLPRRQNKKKEVKMFFYWRFSRKTGCSLESLWKNHGNLKCWSATNFTYGIHYLIVLLPFAPNTRYYRFHNILSNRRQFQINTKYPNAQIICQQYCSIVSIKWKQRNDNFTFLGWGFYLFTYGMEMDGCMADLISLDEKDKHEMKF